MKRKSVLVFLFVCWIFPLTGHAYQAAVVSAHPWATRAGLDILKKGGTALDAAIATAFVLAVVEPHHSGLGGGGFLLFCQASNQNCTFVDYRESAPKKARLSFYQKDPQKIEAGLYSVAVPGFVKGMQVLYERGTTQDWAELVAPAIKVAETGVPLKGALKEKILKAAFKLEKDPQARALFLEPVYRKETLLIQKDLAATLRQIQKKGASVFYEGELANRLGSWMKANKGLVTRNDLKEYQVYVKAPHVFKYKDYSLVSAPLPSSGGMGLEFLFKRAQGFEWNSWGSVAADQNMLTLLREYFDLRETLGDDSLAGQTTHLCVVDHEGNMVAMTNTINSSFGSGLVLPGTGILLNNEMDDFSLIPQNPNRVRGGARPLSSMTPTIIYKANMPHLVLGTPGGTTIPQNLFWILLAAWEGGASLSQALAFPKFFYSPRTQEIWAEEALSPLRKAALKKQVSLHVEPKMGNVQMLEIKGPHKTRFLSDPRWEGWGGSLTDYR